MPKDECKYLTLNTRLNEGELLGLAILLQSCPRVEFLNISKQLPLRDEYCFGCPSDELFRENYWISRPCWVLHLKTLRIDGDWIYHSSYFDHIFPFMQAILKNGMVLEKIILASFNDGTWINYHKKVTQTLLSFPRSSRHAVILFSG